MPNKNNINKGKPIILFVNLKKIFKEQRWFEEVRFNLVDLIENKHDISY